MRADELHPGMLVQLARGNEPVLVLSVLPGMWDSITFSYLARDRILTCAVSKSSTIFGQVK